MGAGLKTHWLLAELGMSYENPSLDMKAGEHKKPEFMKLNPTGQVPVLIDGDFVLFESLAINQYLAEKAGSDLAGKDGKEKALILQWSLSFSYHPLKHLGVLSQHKSSRKPASRTRSVQQGPGRKRLPRRRSFHPGGDQHRKCDDLCRLRRIRLFPVHQYRPLDEKRHESLSLHQSQRRSKINTLRRVL
jgi:hypothetical protein